MKFTNQYTTDREFFEYSEPMTKEQVADIWSRIYPHNSNTAEKIRMIMVGLLSKLNDQDFIYNFNRTLNIKIRSFGPNMFQIRYNNTHVFN